MDDDDFGRWPQHVQAIFIAVGRAMNEKRLYPKTVQLVPNGPNAILPGHRVFIRHVSGKELGRRKGYYIVTVDGPIFGGKWSFQPGKLERLSRSAASASGRP
jgi:hypothetical protein